jgi:hypothetical protein
MNYLVSYSPWLCSKLLGDKRASQEIGGLGQLLRNRCAYLIGNSYQHRSELLRDFDKIYDVRSQIVHSGKNKLTADERRLFHQLRSMCASVICKEISLLEADLKRAE